MQSLFEMDFNNYPDSEIEDIVNRDIEEFAPGIEDADFTRSLAKGVSQKLDKLDKIIEKAAPEWPLSQIAIVDRNVLRIGIYELLFGNKKEVPVKVAINEAIELAKTFGGDSSGKFVNGVLGTIYREMTGSDAKKEMPREKLAGAVVYKKEGKEILFALVHDFFGYWTLSKGHSEENEDLKETAKRKVREEIGISVVVKDELGVNEYIASDPEKGKIKKLVVYFLASAQKEDEKLNLKQTGGLDEARWFKLEELADLKMYDDIRPIITKAVKIIVGQK